MKSTALHYRSAVGVAAASAFALALSACEQRPPSASMKTADRAEVQAGAPKERADAPRPAPADVTGEQRRPQPADPGSLVAQARSDAAAQSSAPAEHATSPGTTAALPRDAPAAGKPSTPGRPIGDDELAARVKSAVLAEPLSALLFNVNVANGVVTLSGTADSAATRDKAARAAARVEGVKSVDNRITIASGS